MGVVQNCMVSVLRRGLDDAARVVGVEGCGDGMAYSGRYRGRLGRADCGDPHRHQLSRRGHEVQAPLVGHGCQ